MDVGSVSSAANAYSNSVQQATQTQQVQQVAERREPPPEQRVEAQEGPRPVKNAEGQTTGSVISVTA